MEFSIPTVEFERAKEKEEQLVSEYANLSIIDEYQEDSKELATQLESKIKAREWER